MDPAIAGKLRILTTTPGYVPHAFAAHPRLPADVLDKVRQAMFSLGNDETGRRLLEPLSFKGIEAGQDKDWDEIRKLGIDHPVGQTKTSSAK
jgi:phosphonate transport system substrate-binding protein